MPAGIGGPAPTALVGEPRAWDSWVASLPDGSFPQLDAWARAARGRGWRSRRLAVGASGGVVGAQLLIHRMAPGPWSRAYSPRGPLAERLDREALEAFRSEVWRVAGEERLAHLVVDPPMEAGRGVETWLEEGGWQRVPARQVNRTRIVELGVPEATLWSGLRSSARWSVNRARRDGLTVDDAGRAGLDEFERMYLATARRVGFSAGSARAVVDGFMEDGATRLLLCRGPDGVALAGLALVPCGQRLAEVYGAATPEGATRRAGYLLKWEAIRDARERGYREYDMWGADDPGIAEFKAAFGGREVEYIGAWSLVTDRLAERLLATARAGRSSIARLRRRPGR